MAKLVTAIRVLPLLAALVLGAGCGESQPKGGTLSNEQQNQQMDEMKQKMANPGKAGATSGGGNSQADQMRRMMGGQGK